ncbi:MAG: cyclase family protein [Planctomycetota bacterium]|nr:MAG: cyclase family protein [Planctomycetota bacterium]
MGRLIDLSHPLVDGQLSYPNDPPLVIRDYRTIKSGGCNVSSVQFGTHQGTHLDAPYHFIERGTPLDGIPLERFYGPAALVDLAPDGALPPKTPITAEMLAAHADAFSPQGRVILRTGWYSRFNTPEYFTDLPSLTEDAATWIAERKIWLLGMDMPTPSKIAGRRCHEILLAPGTEIVIVEGLTNLHELPSRFILAAFPLNFAGRDGSPVRAVGIVE